MKANILIRIAALGALLLSAAACVFPFPVEADQDGDLPLVIEGDLKIGGTTTVSVSHVRPLKKGSGAVGNFSVEGYVEGEDGTRVEGQSQVWGSEKRRISFDTGQLRGDQRYRLHLETVSGSNGKKEVVESDWLTVTQAPVIDDRSSIIAGRARTPARSTSSPRPTRPMTASKSWPSIPSRCATCVSRRCTA